MLTLLFFFLFNSTDLFARFPAHTHTRRFVRSFTLHPVTMINQNITEPKPSKSRLLEKSIWIEYAFLFCYCCCQIYTMVAQPTDVRRPAAFNSNKHSLIHVRYVMLCSTETAPNRPPANASKHWLTDAHAISKSNCTRINAIWSTVI